MFGKFAFSFQLLVLLLVYSIKILWELSFIIYFTNNEQCIWKNSEWKFACVEIINIYYCTYVEIKTDNLTTYLQYITREMAWVY